MTKDADEKSSTKGNSPEVTTRRMAIKRIAAAVSGAAAGATFLASAKPASAQKKYISIEGSYVNVVYSNYSNYSRHISYYTSYSSHSIYVPPPYIKR